MCLLILSFGGASLTIFRKKLTKGTLSHSMLIKQWIYVRGSSSLGIMPVDNEQWHAEIAKFLYFCLQYYFSAFKKTTVPLSF